MNRRRARLSIYPTWLSSWLIIALTMSLVLRPAYPWTGVHTGAVPDIATMAAATEPPTCTGPHDLMVDQGRVVLQGVQTLDRLCVLSCERGQGNRI